MRLDASIAALERPKRDKDDFFATPGWAIRAVLPRLPDAQQIIDPGAGDGAIVRELLVSRFATSEIFAVEKDPVRAAHCATLTRTVCGDFLKIPDQVEPRFDLAIMNPPYRHAEAFVRKARGLAIVTVALLRVGFLASQERREWLRADPPDVGILSRRPSFQPRPSVRSPGKMIAGPTDGTEYAWYRWPGTGQVSWLDCEGP